MEEYISRIPFLTLIASFDNAIEPINFLKSNQVDLMFLDIEMEGFNGLQLIKTLQYKPKIILTTAYDQYAIEAFDLNVSDYLLKPISFERFIKSIDKIFDHFVSSKSIEANEPIYKRDYFFVKTEFRMQRVDFDDILFIEGMNEYLRINTRDEKIMTLQNFKSMEQDLPNNNFIRVHKSYMVAINKIESIEKSRIKIGDKLIPISNTYKDSFYLMLNKR
ncbi:MAG: DNA-binding response regulator [Marinilabiliales bacterium]|nr:MAG: DNA-binding response regulator [Marinilabiliales bacterium]